MCAVYFGFYVSTSYARRRLLCYHCVLMSVPSSQCPVTMFALFLLLTNAEQISMKFGGGNHYHQQMNWLHFGWNCTRMDKGTGYDRKFELTLHQCCHVNVYLYSASSQSASNALSLPVRLRWSPQTSPPSRHQQTLQDHVYRPQGWRVHYTYAVVEASYDCMWCLAV